ncbi:MAG: SUMF1/EgtB/PvdO family nonheme iron enzyme [Thalassospira sp.]|uniref:formylglycine-generating enzyme family protein n=1 Tax=Thalassospira sp. TaxID=1912094 RepID=UPI0032EFB9B7
MKFGDSIASIQKICAAACLVAFAGLSSAKADDAVPEVVEIPTGWFWQGSDSVEREYAYQIDEQVYGHDISRRNRWYDIETDKWRVHLLGYHISKTPVTNDQYAIFVKETDYPAPELSQDEWNRQGLIYNYDTVQPFLWSKGNPPNGRGDHPVVLVSWQDAVAYTEWLSTKTGKKWRLPSEIFWEKAVRGPDGVFYPWGNIFDPELLNSGDRGPFDTMPVGQFEAGPYGLHDGVGQVFEWTSTSKQAGYRLVKGGSWDDRGCGVCRPAAQHARPEHLKHILIGFRVMYID